MPVKVLFVNNSPATCGVNAYGKSTYAFLSRSKALQTEYAPCDNWDELKKHIDEFSPNVILYNYHSYTLSWVIDANLSQYPHIRHIAIVHEAGMQTPTRISKRILPDSLPRALFECEDKYVEPRVPVIGSFGFGSWHKGFHNLILMIQDQFDEAVLRLHMPPSFYCDPNADMSRQVTAECISRITKPGISVEADYEFFSIEKLLEWLNQNTLNAFHYEPLPYAPGISSVIDYALSAHRPLAITKSPMFRHIVGATPSIYLEEMPMKQIIANGVTPLLPFYEKWSEANFIKYWEDLICTA